MISFLYLKFLYALEFNCKHLYVLVRQFSPILGEIICLTYSDLASSLVSLELGKPLSCPMTAKINNFNCKKKKKNRYKPALISLCTNSHRNSKCPKNVSSRYPTNSPDSDIISRSKPNHHQINTSFVLSDGKMKRKTRN